MAKRKRLTPVPKGHTTPWTGETQVTDFGMAPPTRRAAPIADVAGQAAQQAALEEVASELTDARREGRLVQRIALDAIDETHLVRDRISADEGEMEALIASLRARGQQTPMEVVDLGKGRYGLISGWRRLVALRQLRAEGAEGVDTAQCLIRTPEGSSDAYIAMVEENEIRAGLSFYERARIAARAAEQGAYPDARKAVKGLFANVSYSKRSKIVSFLKLYEALDDVLRFPGALSERMGLALVKALDEGVDIRGALTRAQPTTAAEEIAALEAAMRVAAPRAEKDVVEAAPLDVSLRYQAGEILLTGEDVTEALAKRLEGWLRKQG